MSDNDTDLGLHINGPLATDDVTTPTGAPSKAYQYDQNMELIDAILEALIAGGYPAPVISVAGKTGAVVLGEADITGLVADLALKAPQLTPIFSGLATFEQDNLGNNIAHTATVSIKNATPATSTVAQNPGSATFNGSYWDGTQSQQALIAEIIATWGAGNPTSANLVCSLYPPSGKNAFVIFKNATAATAGQNQGAPQFVFQGFYWDGTASQGEFWEVNTDLSAGATPTTRLSINHFGSPGQATLDLANQNGHGGTSYKVLVPNVTAADNSFNAANTKYVDAAVGVETTRATAAEGVLTTAVAAKQSTSAKDAASGYAGLDSATLLQCAELPPWVIEGVNNSIVRGPVDASGNPNYTSVATVSTVATLTVNGNTTNLEMYIDGQRQLVVDQLLTVVLNNGGGSTTPQANFVYLKKNTGGTNLTSSQIGVTKNAFVFGNNQTAPSTAAATSSNPVYWFDPTTSQWKKATSNGGSFTADPIIPICVAVVSNTGVLLGTGYWGPRWTPWKVMEFCGQGSDGALNVQNGTTTINGTKYYSSLVVSGGILTHTGRNGSFPGGMWLFSQSPIVICNAGTTTSDGLGNAGGAAATTTAQNGNTSVGIVSTGGGGGGTAGTVGLAAPNQSVPYALNGGLSGGAAGVGGSLVLTSVAVAGGNAVYNGTITNGTNPKLVGAKLTVTGFTNAGNNVTSVTITAATATTITVATTTQVNETHAGTAVCPCAGGDGLSVFANGGAPFYLSMSIQGYAGGAPAGGAGDGGAASGGAGGNSGGCTGVHAPGIFIASTSTVTARGTNGSAGGGTNGAGGGGGGGGTLILYYGYLSNAGTISVAGGTGGAAAGTGGAGGNGGAGLLLSQRLF